MKKLASIIMYSILGVVLAQSSWVSGFNQEQAFGQTNTFNPDTTSLSSAFSSLGNFVIYILVSLAVIWIVYQIVRYLIIGGSDPEKRGEAGKMILWGIVGLFVILSIWGLVRILKGTFNTGNNIAPSEQFPQIPVQGTR